MDQTDQPQSTRLRHTSKRAELQSDTSISREKAYTFKVAKK